MNLNGTVKQYNKHEIFRLKSPIDMSAPRIEHATTQIESFISFTRETIKVIFQLGTLFINRSCSPAN